MILGAKTSYPAYANDISAWMQRKRRDLVGGGGGVAIRPRDIYNSCKEIITTS